jgi:hypothetical protein
VLKRGGGILTRVTKAMVPNVGGDNGGQDVEDFTGFGW